MWNLVIIFLSIVSISVGNKPIPFGDEARLLRKLMRGYEKAVRPVMNASHVMSVNVGFSLTQILDMDEKNQILTTNVWISLVWSDQKLVWDPVDYNGLKKLRIPPDLIWRPDIVLYNGVDDFGDKVYSQCLAMVEYDGTVLWAPIANLKSSCKLDLTYFPFDDQVCRLKFGSWAYDGSQVDLTSQNSELEMRQYIKNGGWDVIKTKVIRNVVTYPCCPHEPYPDVTFSIYLRRRSLYYVINIIIPCILLSCLSLFGFFLPVGTGEKVSLGLTVLLAFYVLGLSLADRIPETSEYIPLIGLYLTIIMVLTALSIAMCVYVIQLHHRGDKDLPVPPWLYKTTTKYLARLLCMTSYIRYQKPFYENGLNTEECEPLSSGYTSNKGTMTRINAEKSLHFRKVPTENNGSIIRHDDRNINCHQSFNNNFGNEDPWVKANNHTSIKTKDLPVERQICTNEKMWHDMAHVWDRFCLLLEFIAITVSTVSILIIMPLLKEDNFAS